MVSKKTKESKEYQEQEKQSAKEEGDIEQIVLNKDKPEPKEREPTIEEQIITMTEIQYRTLIIEILSEILGRMRQKDDTNTTT
jgi:hypothetical protein